MASDLKQSEAFIKNIITDVSSCQPEDIQNDQPLIEIVRDSIRMLEIIARLEDQYHLNLNADEMEKLRTVNDILRYISRH